MAKTILVTGAVLLLLSQTRASCPNGMSWYTSTNYCAFEEAQNLTPIVLGPYNRELSGSTFYSFQGNNIHTNYFSPSNYIYIGDQGDTVSCNGDAKYGCNTTGRYTYKAASGSISCNNDYFPNPWSGTAKECACFVSGSSCTRTYSMSAHSYVTIENASTMSTVGLRIPYQNPFRSTITVTMTQTDNLNRSISQNMRFEIIVCGNEVMSVNSATPMEYYYSSTSGTNVVLYRSTDINSQFTLTNNQANTHTSCGIRAFELYDDAACTTKNTFSQLVMTGDLDNYGGTNSLTIVRNTAFTLKTRYICYYSLGLAKAVKQILIEICGSETVSLVDATLKSYRYLKNSNSGTEQITDLYTSWYTVDSSNCPLANPTKHNNAGTAYTGSLVNINTSTKKVTFSTTTVHDTYFKIRGQTSQSPNVADQQIRVTICETVPTLTLTTQPNYVYFKNQHTPYIELADVSTWFTAWGNNCPMHQTPGEDYTVRDTSGNIDSTNIVFIDTVSHKLRIKTDTPYIATLRIYARSDMDVLRYQTITVHVCGQEVISTTQTSVPQFILQRYAGTANKVTYVARLPTYFTNNYATNCPIVGYKILQLEGSTYSEVPAVLISVSGDDLIISTATPIQAQSFYVQGYTNSARENKQEIFVRVCGNEALTLTQTSDPNYTYDFNTGTKTPVVVTTFFVDETYCPITSYKLQTLAGGVYSDYTAAQVTINAADKKLTILTSTALNSLELYVTATTATPVVNRQKVIIHVCGSEVLSASSSYAAVPQYYYLLNDNGGTQIVGDASSYFVTSQAKCPITAYLVMKDVSGTCTAYSDVPARVELITAGTSNFVQILTSTSQTEVTFCIKANTNTAGKIFYKKFKVLVCGFETVSIVNVATLKYVYLRNSGTFKPIDVTTIFSTSDSRCPIESYNVMQQMLGQYVEYTYQVSIDSSKFLTVDATNPMDVTLFIQASTSTPVTLRKQFELKVCGNEIIRWAIYDKYEYLYLVGSGTVNIQMPSNVITWFSVSDPDCPLKEVTLHKYESPNFPAYTGTDVVLQTLGSAKMLAINTSVVRQQQLAVKGSTVSNIESVVPLSIFVCQGPTATKTPVDLTLNKSQGVVFVANASSLFDLTNVCPILSYSLHSLTSSGTYEAYINTDIYLTAGNQIYAQTGASFKKTVYLKISAQFDTFSYQAVNIIVCGTEVMRLVNTNYQTTKLEYRQGTGIQNITQKWFYTGDPIVESSIKGCPVARHELFFYNSTTRQVEPFRNSTVKLDNQTARLTINTTLAADAKLILRINSLYGSYPAELSLNVVVIAKPDFKFNAKPILTNPPSGSNLVISPNIKSTVTGSIIISQVFDDYNEPRFLNFTNRDFGKLSYEYQGDTPMLSQQRSDFMHFDPTTTELTVTFKNYEQALRYHGKNLIEIDISDSLGATNTYTTTLSIYKASESIDIEDDGEGNSTKNETRKNETVTLVSPPGFWFAYIEKVSVIGDVYIKFNQLIDRKDFDINSISKDTLDVYLDYTTDRVQDNVIVSDFNFSWTPVKLGDDFLHINCNFTKPFSISQNPKFDRIMVHFKAIPEFFEVQYHRGLQEAEYFGNYTTISAVVPRQIDSADYRLIETAQAINFLLSMFVFGSIILSFVFKYSAERFLYTLNELQLLFHLPLLGLEVPGNVLIVFTNLINLVRYDFLQHLKLLNYADSVADARDHQHKYFNGYWFQLGYKSYNLYANIGTLFILICCCLTVWGTMAILNRLPFCRKRKGHLQKIHKKTKRLAFDGRLLFLSSYLVLAVAACILVTAPRGSIDRTGFNQLMSSLILIFVISFPLYLFWKFKKNSRDQQSIFGDQQKRVGLFFFKRISFIFIAFVIAEGSLQSVLISYVYLAALIAFAQFKPQKTKLSNHQGVINDFLLLSIVVHIFYFTPLFDEKSKYTIGKSMLVFIWIFICFNFATFLGGGLSGLRLGLLRIMPPGIRHDFLICLGYLKLRWLFLTEYPTKQEREQARLQRIEEFLNRKDQPLDWKGKLKKFLMLVWTIGYWPVKKIREDNVHLKLWKWLLKRVRSDSTFHNSDESSPDFDFIEWLRQWSLFKRKENHNQNQFKELANMSVSEASHDLSVHEQSFKILKVTETKSPNNFTFESPDKISHSSTPVTGGNLNESKAEGLFGESENFLKQPISIINEAEITINKVEEPEENEETTLGVKNRRMTYAPMLIRKELNKALSNMDPKQTQQISDLDQTQRLEMIDEEKHDEQQIQDNDQEVNQEQNEEQKETESKDDKDGSQEDSDQSDGEEQESYGQDKASAGVKKRRMTYAPMLIRKELNNPLSNMDPKQTQQISDPTLRQEITDNLDHQQQDQGKGSQHDQDGSQEDSEQSRTEIEEETENRLQKGVPHEDLADEFEEKKSDRIDLNQENQTSSQDVQQVQPTNHTVDAAKPKKTKRKKASKAQPTNGKQLLYSSSIYDYTAGMNL